MAFWVRFLDALCERDEEEEEEERANKRGGVNSPKSGPILVIKQTRKKSACAQNIPNNKFARLNF